MKHGKKPTAKQRQAIIKARKNPDNWLVCKDTSTEMVLEHRMTGTIWVIRKELYR